MLIYFFFFEDELLLVVDGVLPWRGEPFVVAFILLASVELGLLTRSVCETPVLGFRLSE